jgi:hypothetical protein
MQNYSVNMDQIYIQSLSFDSETYLKAVHANTGIAKMHGYLEELES